MHQSCKVLSGWNCVELVRERAVEGEMLRWPLGSWRQKEESQPDRVIVRCGRLGELDKLGNLQGVVMNRI